MILLSHRLTPISSVQIRYDADIRSYHRSVFFIVPGLMDAGGSLGGGMKNKWGFLFHPISLSY